MYNRDEYIEEIQPGVRGYGKYKYRVLCKDKFNPSHHTNSLPDAEQWADKCINHWIEADELSQ